MMFTNILNSPLIFIGGVVLIFLIILLCWLQLKSRIQLQKQLNKHEQVQQQNEREIKKLNKQLLELRSVVVGLGQKVTKQQDTNKHINERISELEHVDITGSLYSRASKMVQLGADINELIEECDLPKAEAELMLSLQKKLAGKEKMPPLSRKLSESQVPTSKG